jgi:hypothetical protein
LLILACVAAPAAARVYCCVDDQGRRVCGDILPAQCLTRAYEELNEHGIIKRRFDAPLTSEQRAERNAELARQKAAERAAAEQARRDRVILSSYTSVADIDARRTRTLAAAQAEVNAAQERLLATQAKREELRQRAARYGDNPLPEVLQANLQDIEVEVITRQTTLDILRKELASTQERFDQDRRKYLELTSRRKAVVPSLDEPDATPP